KAPASNQNEMHAACSVPTELASVSALLQKFYVRVLATEHDASTHQKPRIAREVTTASTAMDFEPKKFRLLTLLNTIRVCAPRAFVRYPGRTLRVETEAPSIPLCTTNFVKNLSPQHHANIRVGRLLTNIDMFVQES
ncbi:MAG TPA: hypothetical protein VEJ63_07585, partial [Planctomycetota bacterium]|nr:hypothetical protein [Planctomycetota bacterium]